MKRLLSLLLFFLNISVAAASDVVISQVLYDPLNESGSEAVELRNTGSSALNIGGWLLMTETSAADATIPTGTILQPGSFYLIADAGWAAGKDNAAWRNANHEEAITLANADAGVALSNSSSIVDAIGWGNAANIGVGLFEGTPHSGSGEGQVLLRQQDTGNNSNDFIAAAANFPQAGSKQITITAVVTGSAAIITVINITPDDDSSSNGIQVAPVPGGNREILIAATISDNDGHGDIAVATATLLNKTISLQKTVVTNATTAIFAAAVNLSYNLSAGNYTVNITAADSGFQTAATATFEYLSLLSLELDTSSIVLAAPPGSSTEIIGDADKTTSNITISNSGNVVADILLSATNLSYSSGSINAANLQYSFDSSNYNSSSAGNLAAARTISLGIVPGQSRGMSIRLGIPTGTVPGNYTGTITLVGTKS